MPDSEQIHPWKTASAVPESMILSLCLEPAGHTMISMSLVLDRLRSLLQSAAASFQETTHAPVYTSEEAAAVRGAPLASGAKALVVKAGDQFFLLVIPADRKLESKLARQALGTKDLRFASKDELRDLTGLQPG